MVQPPTGLRVIHFESIHSKKTGIDWMKCVFVTNSGEAISGFLHQDKFDLFDNPKKPTIIRLGDYGTEIKENNGSFMRQIYLGQNEETSN